MLFRDLDERPEYDGKSEGARVTRAPSEMRQMNGRQARGLAAETVAARRQRTTGSAVEAVLLGIGRRPIIPRLRQRPLPARVGIRVRTYRPVVVVATVPARSVVRRDIRAVRAIMATHVLVSVGGSTDNHEDHGGKSSLQHYGPLFSGVTASRSLDRAKLLDHNPGCWGA